MKYYFLLLISIIEIFCVYAQNPPCQPEFPGCTYTVVENDRFAQLRTDMPLDVLIAYIAWDSACRYGDYNELNEFFERQTTFTDTVKKIIKYAFLAVDYNPILFSKNRWYISDNLKFPPSDLFNELIKTVRIVSTYPQLDNALLVSNYILRIKAISVNQVENPRSADGRDIVNIDAEILDTIKGRLMPDYCSYGSVVRDKRENEALSIPGNYIKFWYCPQWGRGDIFNGPPLTDSLGNSWIKEGYEYIVFLQSVITCNDSTTIYHTIYPIGLNTETYTMYPIKENGEVFNPGNDFGFGTSIHYSEFIELLRERIIEIKNY